MMEGELESKRGRSIQRLNNVLMGGDEQAN
jgi:hypothetical protein